MRNFNLWSGLQVRVTPDTPKKKKLPKKGCRVRHVRAIKLTDQEVIDLRNQKGRHAWMRDVDYLKLIWNNRISVGYYKNILAGNVRRDAEMK